MARASEDGMEGYSSAYEYRWLILATSEMNSRTIHLSFYATVVILVAAPLAYMMGWL